MQEVFDLFQLLQLSAVYVDKSQEEKETNLELHFF